ncbi:hypothetical protein ACFO25_06975 [Paenactinomyces guangxiensis]|uniref:Uncharacterized protein n=1 Tax=Paenactinomyces guangxiensis TaxID=1490290 RepID=A0A7W1WNL5_9BACL|nr:hypothetical protein [Paenactinomyces guangxiensis]MBA4493210.1 hypothetical protein [Paenactinomyces guangxiensis]MBH8589940.1 hypothetical protein [Paenactinomyces guangxiensis]
MSGMRRFFSGITETGDRAPEDWLRSRYYRGRSLEAGDQLLQLPKQHPSFKFVHYDKERGEVMFEYRNPLGFTHDIVITIYEITPIRLAVDIHAAIRSRMFDFGWNRKIVGIIYSYLDQKLTKDTKS